MKNQHIILTALIAFGLVSCSGDQQLQTRELPAPLGEIQSVWSQQNKIQKSLSKTHTITPEQEKLFEISSVFHAESTKFDNQLLEILQKYNSTISQEEIDKIKVLLSKNLTSLELQQILSQEFSIEMLENEVTNLQSKWFQFLDEKNVHTERLKYSQDTKTFDIIKQRDQIITTMISDILSNSESWTQTEKETIIQEILSYFYQNNYTTEIDSFTEIIEYIQQEYRVTVDTETITSSEYIFDQMSFQDFLRELTQTYETVLSYNELIENYSIYTTNLLLLENINQEISLIESDTPLTQYETILSENTSQIESIYETTEVYNTLTQEEIQSYFKQELDYSEIELLHKERVLENSTLPDIQSRVLEQEYIDDSELIADMTPLAYIENISQDNLLVTNLSGGLRLGEENMLLYAGYTVETYPNTTASIIFSDESVLRLEENSKVVLSQSSSNNTSVNVEYGNIWTRVIKPLFSQDSLEITSQSVSLAVRGTSVYIQKSSDSAMTAYVVDSYSTEQEQGVELRNSISGENITLSSGEVYQTNDTTNPGQKTSFSKANIMQDIPTVSEYLRKDLQYLALTLDDRARGFYNNPISEKNDSQNFIDKISGEIEASLPRDEEIGFLFKNSETPKTNISKDTIYLRIMQDELISNIKESTNDDTSSKISAISNMDIDLLRKDMENLREIENRIDLKISQDLIDSPTLSPQSINNIFTDFGLDEQQAQINKLDRARKHLKETINQGSPYLSQDLELPRTYNTDVSINWISGNSEYLSDQGKIIKYSLERDIITSLTAFLQIGNQELSLNLPIIIKKKIPSQEEELMKSREVLEEYINNIQFFTDTIHLPDFNNQDAVIPKITWKSDGVVQTDGSINRPTFAEQDIINHSAIATLNFGDAVLENQIFILKRIKKQTEIPEAIQTEFNVNSAASKFPGCNVRDIELSNGQVWAMCNAGSSISGITSESFGGRYDYKKGHAQAACNHPGYKLPSKSDWEGAIENLGSISNTALVLQLPKAGGYYKKYSIGSGDNITNEKRYWSTTEGSDDEYYTLTDTKLEEEPRKSDYSVRCIQTDFIEPTIDPVTSPTGPVSETPDVVSPDVESEETISPIDDIPVVSDTSLPGDSPTVSEIADQLLISEKNKLINYFSNTKNIGNDIQNIKDLSGFPVINSKVTLTWSKGNPFLGANGTIQSPKYNQGDKQKSIQVGLEHIDTGKIEYITDIAVVFKKLSCSGELIGGSCYDLVASAEYNTAGDYSLKRDGAPNIGANVGSGVNNNDVDLQDSSRGITQLEKYKSFVQVGNQKGILLDNSGTDDYLSYDLSSLNLGDDWAIEMSVRGEDLKRSGSNNGLLAIPGQIYVYQYNGLLKKSDSEGITGFSTNNLSGYQIIQITSNGLFLNSDKKLNIGLNGISEIKIGSHKDYKQQWNGIIDYVKILKKKD